MKLHIFPADEAACGFYRMRLPARLAAEEGHEVSVEEDQSPKLEAFFEDERIIGCKKPDCDIIVFQRPLHWHIFNLIPFLQEHGVAVVVEVDDDFHAVDKLHPAAIALNPRTNRTFNTDFLMRACALADWVTVSTPSLLRRYGFGHGSVVRNRLDRDMLHRRPVSREKALAWAGNPRSHPKDLTAVGTGVLEALGENRDWHALLITEVCEALDELQVPHGQGRCEDGVPFSQYFETISRFGIGLAPLRLIPFNTAKSFLKPLEYAATATPCVASPTSEYRMAARIGLCKTAETPSEWKRALTTWMASDDARQEAGEKAQAAAEDWYAQDHFEEWENAWRQALERRARAK